MKRIVMFILIMTIISLMSISFADIGSNPEIELYEDDTAKELKIEAEIVYIDINGTVEINIAENPTTGYTWHMNVDNDELVEVVVDEFTAPNAEGVVGAGGMHTWIIDAVDQGIVTMTFEYYRDWEPENVAEIREYVINIVPDGAEEVYINDFISDEAIPELISIDESQPEAISIEVEELNLFQRFIRWIINIFK